MDFRDAMGTTVMIGLEFLVAADLIRTVTIDPTFENVGSLGLLILLRTVLSFAIEVEINGYWPWKRPNAATSPQDEA